MADVDIVVRLKDEASGKLGQLDKSLEGVGKSTDKMATGFSAAKAAVTGFLALGVTRALLDFGKASIDAASHVEEMTNKFDVVFGQSAPRAKQVLQELGDTVNRSSFELMGMAASLQDTFVPLGFARDKAAEMSTEMTGLVVDVASFNDALDTDVMRDFQSAIVGETQAVRKYGIVITEANTKQKAYEMGIASVGEELTEQEKVQARIQLLWEGTSDAQGDAARTADSYANVSKGLKAATSELSATIGDMLIPSVTKAKIALTDLINSSTKLLEKETQLMDAYRDGSITFFELLGVMGQIETGQWSQAEAVDWLNEKLAENATVTQDVVVIGKEFNDMTFFQALAAEQAGEKISALDYATAGYKTSADLAKEKTIEFKEGLENISGPAGRAKKSLSGVADEAQRVATGSETAKGAFDGMWDSLNRDLGDTVGNLIKDLEFAKAGGGDLQRQVEMINEQFERSGDVAQYEEELKRAFVEAQELEVQLGNITATEAAQSIRDEFNISLQDAQDLMDGIVQTVWELEDPITNTSTNLGLMKQAVEENIPVLDEARDIVKDIAQAVKNAAGEHEIHFTITSSGSVPSQSKAVSSGAPPTRKKKRQHGGPVMPYQAYMVGESGPEMFVPSTAGNIVPNNQLSGGVNIQAININIPGGVSDPRMLVNMISTELAAQLRSALYSGAARAGI